MNKQLQKDKRSENFIIINFTNIGNVLASKEAKLHNCKAFFVVSLCDV